MIHFELIATYGVRWRVEFYFLHVDVHLLKKPSFPVIMASLSKIS